MATLTNPNPQLTAISNHVDTLLRDCEDFYIRKDFPGVHGYMLELRTHLYVHIKHTRKDLFVPHTVYQASTMTALPNKHFMNEYVKNARRAAEKFINNGDYNDEKYVAGEWQTWKRKFNQWYYYDKKRGVLVGELHRVTDLQDTGLDKRKGVNSNAQS